MAEEDMEFDDIAKTNQNELTPEEIEKVEQAFHAFDKDGNGYIDSQELKSVLESSRSDRASSDGAKTQRRRREKHDRRGHLE